jgi:hypothetical protein
MDISESNSPDATVHTRMIGERLQELTDHLRKDVFVVDDPRAKVLFETAAEVLGGLRTAFVHYEEGTEEAWRR